MFEFLFSAEAIRHLDRIRSADRSNIVKRIESQLKYEPLNAARNRKSMRPNKIASWELRVGNFRVYYSVAEVPRRLVTIHAVGQKVHNRVFINGEEVKL